MGLSNFPTAAEGVLPVLVMNTVFSVALFKNMLRSVLQILVGGRWGHQDFDEDQNGPDCGRERRVSITQFKTVLENNSNGLGLDTVECCVCLCAFEDEEEVSELSCKHFFHKGCLAKWVFRNKRTTCPLCRSVE